jgi:hypothetical protein
MAMAETRSDPIIDAVRLGWYVAELHGRNRPGGPRGEAPAAPGAGEGGVLPLRNERSHEAQRREAERVVDCLARRLAVDGDDLSSAVVAQATTLAAAVAAAGEDADADVQAAWARLAARIFAFDAHVQDTLTARDDLEACGYLLGRGLAETYWRMGAPPSPEDWAVLFGDGRCRELTRLVGRVGPHLNVYTAPAVAGSLRAWQAVATGDDPSWRDGGLGQLYLQLRRWYEVLVLGQDPTTMVRPSAVVRGWRPMARTVRLFVPQATAAAGFAAMGVAGAIGGTRVNPLLTAAGAAGLSMTGLQARLKNSSQALLTRLRQDLYTDLVGTAIAIVPRKPQGDRATERAVTRAVRSRELTTNVAV